MILVRPGRKVLGAASVRASGPPASTAPLSKNSLVWRREKKVLAQGGALFYTLTLPGRLSWIKGQSMSHQNAD